MELTNCSELFGHHFAKLLLFLEGILDAWKAIEDVNHNADK